MTVEDIVKSIEEKYRRQKEENKGNKADDYFTGKLTAIGEIKLILIDSKVKEVGFTEEA